MAQISFELTSIRDQFRILLIWSMIGFGSNFLVFFVALPPEDIAVVSEFLNDEQTLSPAFSIIGFLVAIVLIVFQFWAYIQLWKYDNRGVSKFIGVVVAGLIIELLLSSGNWQTPLQSFVSILFYLLDGSLITYCILFPEIFSVLNTPNNFTQPIPAQNETEQVQSNTI